ncbi:MAG: hypothetical protein LBQ66_11390 [Planctomycetaceae bacterium]|nr:hypothetical protein [Planctomycetaceae bacterium]
MQRRPFLGVPFFLVWLFDTQWAGVLVSLMHFPPLLSASTPTQPPDGRLPTLIASMRFTPPLSAIADAILTLSGADKPEPFFSNNEPYILLHYLLFPSLPFL